MSRVLVTGADGFVGSHLCEALRDDGHDVTGLAQNNSFDHYGWLDEISGVKKVRGDIRDPSFILDLATGQEIIFHLAALISVPYSYSAPYCFEQTNVVGTMNVARAALNNGAMLIHTSTSEVYGSVSELITEDCALNPQSPYAASKVSADAFVAAYCKSYGLRAVILRPFNTYGPRQSERAVVSGIIRQALDPTCTSIKLGNLEAVRDLMYVSDTVGAFKAVAKLEDFGVYNAGTGKTISVQSLAWRICKLAKHVKPIETEAERWRPPNSEVEHLRCNAGKLIVATGWKPAVTLDDGLIRTIEWCRQHAHRSRGYIT